MTRTCILILGLLATPLWCEAQEIRNSSAYFRSKVDTPIANVELPKHVETPDGQVAIFADYEQANASGTPLYVVNRSDVEADFSSQDGSLYIKLEYQRPDGTWERAQGIAGSDCGNSYGSRTLPPGQHFKLLGYTVPNGTTAKVRYSNYNGAKAFSNIGTGFYSQADVEAAEGDSMSKAGIPLYLSQYFYTTQRLQDNLLKQETAPQKETIIAALELARVLGKTSFLKKQIEEIITQLSAKTNPTEEDEQVLTALKNLLARPWAPEMDPERLLNYCVQKLSFPSKQNVTYGSPDSSLELLQLTLASLTEPHSITYPESKLLSRASWKPVFEMISNEIRTTTKEGNTWAVLILKNKPDLADEWIDSSVFEASILSDNSSVRHVSIDALARRAKWSRLAELGWKLPPIGQLSVLKHLVKGHIEAEPKGWDTHGLKFRQPKAEEVLFWEHCLRTQPKECALLWQRLSESHRHQYVPLADYLKQQVFSYLESLADQSDKEVTDFRIEPTFQAHVLTTFLLSGKNKSTPFNEAESGSLNITALFNRLLTHKGYINNVSGKEVRYFAIRHAALEALKKLGQPVPEGVVVEDNGLPDPANN